MPPRPKAYILTGPTEDPQSLTLTPPNLPATAPPIRISPTTCVLIRIRDFTGQPVPQSASKEYFSHGNHVGDLFSIQYFFIPPEDIPGDELVLANTFSRPIREHIPYFFPAAWRALRWVDPGIAGDVYADVPEVYGTVLSSANYISAASAGWAHTPVIDEAMPADIPQTRGARKKHFLQEAVRRRWTWRKGTEYRWDFCNGMMDLNDFAVRIPGLGFKIDVFKYWDGQPLRFVLKNQRSGVVYGTVQIELRDEAGMEVAETEVPMNGEEGVD